MTTKPYKVYLFLALVGVFEVAMVRAIWNLNAGPQHERSQACWPMARSSSSPNHTRTASSLDLAEPPCACCRVCKFDGSCPHSVVR